MIDIDQALTDWARRHAQFSPKVWAGHYNEDDRLLGELSLPDADEYEVFIGLVPYALSDVVNAAVAIIDHGEILWAVRMARQGSGHRTTTWIIPVDGMPAMRPWSLGRIPEGLGILTMGSGKETYEAAVLAVSTHYYERNQ